LSTGLFTKETSLLRALSEIEHRLLGLIEPEAKALGLSIVRVRLTGSRTPILQIMAEKADGSMDVEDCAKLSRRLSPMLDEKDPIAGEYTLEVSSPGIDRPLTRPGDFGRWVGHEVRVEIGTPVDGRKRFHGFIAGEMDAVAEINLKDGGVAQIPITEMIKAHLVLTDKLIKTAQDRGQIPEQFEDDVEEEEILDEEDTNEQDRDLKE
jgi:ribosome maturation factor RimP